MTKADWLDVAALVADLWPNQEWTRETIASSYALIADQPVALRDVLGAVRELAATGRDFVPPPGLVVAHAKAKGPGENYHLLAAPDLTRDLSPEEKQRAEEMAKKIRQRVNDLAKSKELARVKA